MTVDPDGVVYVTDYNNHVVRRIRPRMPGFSVDDTLIADEDGISIHHFDSSMRHVQTLHSMTGSTLYSFAYDADGHLSTIEDGDGNITSIERDMDDNPIAIVAPFGQRTTLALEENGYLESITNPANETYSMVYTDNGLLMQFMDPNLHASNMTYDNLGRLLTDENAEEEIQILSRTESEDSYVVTRTTVLNRATSYQVDQLSTGDQRRTIQFPDTTQNEILSITDGSKSISWANGNITNLVEGPDPRFSMQSPLPTQTTIITPDGLVFDQSSTREVELADPYNLLSLISQTDTLTLNGQTFTTNYDGANRNYTNTTPEGRLTTSVIDLQGRVTFEQVSGLAPSNYSYDSHGRLETTIEGSGEESRTTSFVYDDDGYLDSITDPLNQEVLFDYDLAGRVTVQTRPDLEIIQYGYDDKGNLTSLTPPGRPAHQFTYTKTDRLERYVPPVVAGSGTNDTVYAYNDDGQLSSISRPDGKVVDYVYDGAGRLQSITFSRGTQTYTYDENTGQLKTINTPEGNQLTYTYDGDLIKSTTWSGEINGTVSVTYDNDFRVTSRTVNGENTVNYQYDNDGLLVLAGDMTITRDPQNGLVTGTHLGNVTESYTYNEFGEVISYSANYTGTPILSIDYVRDKLGRIIEKTETIEGSADSYVYHYDDVGQLDEVKKNGQVISSYTYDSNGNRESFTSPAGSITASYDDQDRLLQYGETIFTYSANGELLSKSIGSDTTNYIYDEYGNLTLVETADGSIIKYMIDGKNRRVGKYINETLVQVYLYADKLNPVAEFNGNDQIENLFVYGSKTNVPDYFVHDNEKYKIISDHLGSVRVVIDINTGVILQKIDYDVYGVTLHDTNPGIQPFTFAGGITGHHPTSIRFGLRDYSVSYGRWNSKDLILVNNENTNMYTYTNNDPVNYLDVYGLNGLIADINDDDGDDDGDGSDPPTNKCEKICGALDTFSSYLCMIKCTMDEACKLIEKHLPGVGK